MSIAASSFGEACADFRFPTREPRSTSPTLRSAPPAWCWNRSAPVETGLPVWSRYHWGGVNFHITVPDTVPVVAALARANIDLFMKPETRWYRVGNEEVGVNQFLVSDPDGYLIRFQSSRGYRPEFLKLTRLEVSNSGSVSADPMQGAVGSHARQSTRISLRVVLGPRWSSAVA
jgi:hypothetical protein